MVMEGVQEDMGDGNMQCINHPYKNSTPGGICAFCLQEKLGKLVSSSFPIAIFPSSSSSSSPSFRSDYNGVLKTSSSSSSTIPVHPNNLNTTTTTNNGDSGFHYNHYYSRRTRIPFILTQKKKKNKKEPSMAASSASASASASASEQNNIVFKRSKSTATPRRGVHFVDSDGSDLFSPRKRGFWSFIYQSKHATSRKPFREIRYGSTTTTTTTNSTKTGTVPTGSFSQRSKEDEFVVIDENESPNQSSMERKVSRSRSVGCGSRSFSGDLFERISTGFGDCTLRRVESQREGKPKGGGAVAGEHDSMKERVKCGGIFSGFMMNSSYSSSSSASSYWVSSSGEDGINGGRAVAGHMAHGRSKSWGWAFASPIRALGKPSSSSGKREGLNKNTTPTPTPNLAAIPSLLTVVR